MHADMIVPSKKDLSRKTGKILVSTSSIPTEDIYGTLKPEPRDFVPEYKVLTILTKNLGVTGSSILRRQMMKLAIEGPKIPIGKYPDLIRMVEEASTLVASRTIRSKMVRELEELAGRYGTC